MPPASSAPTVTLDGVRIAGDGSGPKTIVADVASGTITFVGAALDAPAGATCAFDASGLLATPALIDSHVHLAYFAGQEAAMARAGLSAAVDLAAPLPFVAQQAGNGTAGRPLRLRLSGPMVTSVGGYPTASWGAHGYGIECATPAQAVAAVRAVHAAGSTVLKLPLMPGGRGLAEVPAVAAVAEAHRLGMKVAAHATGSADAAAALRLGVDVLAHTPTADLDAPTLAGWAADGRAVVSTLRMFGGGSSSSSSANARNLRALHQRGARILYGTDFGNSRVAGPDLGELALMVQAAGMSEAEALAAATTEPARFWGWGSRLGALLPGADASWLLTEAGGSGNSSSIGGLAALGSPLAVFSRGQCFARGAPGRHADWCTGCVMREEAPPARNHTASDGAASSNHTAGGAPPSNQTAGASLPPLPPLHGDGHRGDQTAASGSNWEPWAVPVASLAALVALCAAWRSKRLRKSLAAAPRERLGPAGAAGAGPGAIVVALGGDHNGPQAATL